MKTDKKFVPKLTREGLTDIPLKEYLNILKSIVQTFPSKISDGTENVVIAFVREFEVIEGWETDGLFNKWITKVGDSIVKEIVHQDICVIEEPSFDHFRYEGQEIVKFQFIYYKK